MRTWSRGAARADEVSPVWARPSGRTTLHVAVATLAAATPALLTLFLVHAWLHSGVHAFVPNFWNDQVGYWHRIGSFAKVVFDTGYYAPNEATLPVDAVRYGVNGPWFPALYGTVAMVVGWHTDTSIYINIFVLTVALLAFFASVKLELKGTLLAGVAVATLWPVLLYVATASEESLQQAVAVVFAIIFVRALRSGPTLSRRERIASLSFLIAASIVRYSWGILAPVLIVLWAGKITPRRVVAAVAVGVVILGCSVRLTSALQPPGYNSGADALQGFTSHPIHSITTLASTAAGNLKLFLYPGALDPTAPTFVIRGSLDETGIQSWEIVILIALAVVWALASTGRLDRLSRFGGAPIRESIFHIVNLGGTTLAALLFYLPNGYYRVLGANLLLSILVLIASRRYTIVVAIAVANLVMLPSFHNAYKRWQPNFSLDAAALASQRATMSRLTPYNPKPANPWCNTILVPLEDYDWRVTLIPPGLGVAYADSEDIPAHPKSLYLLIPHEPLPINPALDRNALLERGSIAAGTIYVNIDSACFKGHQP